MALSIFDSTFLPDPLNEGAETSSPVAGTAYTLDVAWGIGSSDTAQSVTTTLSCPGATIDTSYSGGYHGHRVDSGRSRTVDMGWSPDGDSVYLSGSEAAVGFWRITFPSVGSYTITLSTIGTIPVTVSSSAPAATSPTITVLHPGPLNRQPSKLLTLVFSGTYPSGGLDLTNGQIGLRDVLFAGINDTSSLRFGWSAGKMKVYNSGGEVSGSISFTTTGLFIGLSG